MSRSPRVRAEEDASTGFLNRSIPWALLAIADAITGAALIVSRSIDRLAERDDGS